ncbi:MAG: hypothetical protein PUP91_02340 [Rhizonema sp. PD37]|nr:hypothetical protein [Rhizonema sp. PD37]
MHILKFIGSVFVSTALISSFATSCENTQAQSKEPKQPKVPRSTSLLRSKCVNSGIGNVRKEDLDVSIGKAVYTSQFYLGPGYSSASLTCNIKPENPRTLVFQTLNLGFGMRDNDVKSPGAEVRVYLDGRLAESRAVVPTQQALLSVDVSNASNIAIEAVCASSTLYCDRVYFFTAALQPQIPIPQTTNLAPAPTNASPTPIDLSPPTRTNVSPKPK